MAMVSGQSTGGLYWGCPDSWVQGAFKKLEECKSPEIREGWNVDIEKSGDQNKERKFVLNNQPRKKLMNINKGEASQNLDLSFEHKDLLLDHLAK